MQRIIVTTGLLSLFSISLAFADENISGTITDRVSLFAVPFICEAAPQIGCGSLSKPVSLDLEHDPAIKEAWLNRTGTVLAVVGSDASSQQSTSEAVQSVFEKHGIAVNQLQGDVYAEQSKSFTARADWYRAPKSTLLAK